MTQNEKLKILRKKKRILQKAVRGKQRKVTRNKLVLHKMSRMADLLQSYIPDRSRWRDVFLITAN
jgi:hypothetical protein